MKDEELKGAKRVYREAAYQNWEKTCWWTSSKTSTSEAVRRSGGCRSTKRSPTRAVSLLLVALLDILTYQVSTATFSVWFMEHDMMCRHLCSVQNLEYWCVVSLTCLAIVEWFFYGSCDVEFSNYHAWCKDWEFTFWVAWLSCALSLSNYCVLLAIYETICYMQIISVWIVGIY
jgi:hypothetical protein